MLAGTAQSWRQQNGQFHSGDDIMREHVHGGDTVGDGAGAVYAEEHVCVEDGELGVSQVEAGHEEHRDRECEREKDVERQLRSG